MFSIAWSIVYYSWLFVKYRKDISAASNIFIKIYENRKMIKYHFNNIVRLSTMNIIENYLE